MIKISGTKILAQKFDSHVHVCDLIEMDGPLLSLYTDARDNWLYLWGDTDQVSTNRWLLHKASRKNLIDFFQGAITLRAIFDESRRAIVLDEEVVRTAKQTDDGIVYVKSVRRRFKDVPASDVQSYFPSINSYFNVELTDAIDEEQSLVPRKYLIPVDGRWYFKDLDGFSRLYAKIYSLLYSTKNQFINSMNSRLTDLLRAPWTGGYSRVNFFSSLRRGLPALHDLQIDSFNYASPGAIEVEALPEICEDVKAVALCCLQNNEGLAFLDRLLDTSISKHKLKKVDLSACSDSDLPYEADELLAIESRCAEFCSLLGIHDRSGALREASPNVVVYAKAIQAFFGQVSKLASFQVDGLIRLDKTQDEAAADVKASALAKL